MRRIIISAAVSIFLSPTALLLGVGGGAWAVPIGGIEFPQGALSFADEVFSYSPGDGVANGWNDPLDALGVPDSIGPAQLDRGTVASLGSGGSLMLRFTDNSLTTSGNDTPDLHIFEAGTPEWFNLSISTDAVSWIDLGDVRGRTVSVDIDGIAGVVAGTSYSFVRMLDILPDDSQNIQRAEADIDAVGAISTAPPVTVPEPAPLSLLLAGLSAVGFRRLITRPIR